VYSSTASAGIFFVCAIETSLQYVEDTIARATSKACSWIGASTSTHGATIAENVGFWRDPADLSAQEVGSYWPLKTSCANKWKS
jgi:hypothetical protein